MDTVNLTLQALVEEFVKVAQGVRLRRWRLGEIYNSMCEVASASTVVSALKRAIPNARDELGYAITKVNLDNMGNMARTFAEQGRVVSPDGAHELSREDIEALSLTPQQTSTLADLLKDGKLHVKKVAQQARKAAKTEPGSDKHDAAKGKVVDLITTAVNGKPERTTASIAEEIEKVDAQIKALTEKRGKLVAEMVELRDAKIAPTKVDGAKVESAPTKSERKPKARRPQASVTA